MVNGNELKSHYDVIIIGAGISGIAAARTLYDNGYENFAVLECSDKIGGRIRLTEFENKTYATGAGWLHGKKNNPLYDLAIKLGINIEQCPLEGDHIYYAVDSENGQDVSESYMNKRNQLSNDLKNIFNNIASQNTKVSVYDSILDVITRYDKFQNMNNLDKTVVNTSYEIYCGARLQDLSGLAEIEAIDEIYEDYYANYRILDHFGIPKIIDYLVEPLHTKIHLKNYVSRIDWQPDNVDDNETIGAILDIKSANESLKNGYSIHRVSCRRVIITIQSQLLLESPRLFQPAIPQYKLDAWKAVPAVDYCRLVVRFPKVFWPAQSEWLVNVTNNPSAEMSFWQNLAGQNFHDADPNVLVCHLTTSLSSSSQHSAQGLHFSQLSQPELIEKIHNTMIKMFPNEYIDSSEDDYRKPCAAVLVSHFTNPDQINNDNSLSSHGEELRWWGAFSSIGLGFDPVKTEHDLLKGLTNESHEVVLFAGESTKPRLIGTLQAAFISGKEAAIKCLHK